MGAHLVTVSLVALLWIKFFVRAKNIALIGPSMVRALGPYWLPNKSKSSATSQCAYEFLVANIT